MNRSMLMIMGGALVIAIIVAMIVQMKLAPKKEEVVAVNTTEILIANKTMLTGDILKSENVRWEAVPDKLVYKGMIKKKDQGEDTQLKYFGKPLKRNVESGEPVTTQALIANAEGGGNYLSASISPGMRAVAVSVKAETAAGGFISPGDYVDVIMTYQISLKGDAQDYAGIAIQKYGSETVLTNVKVLAVDQNAKEDERTAKVGKTVTLEVTREGAQIINMASGMGDISLALRRLGEKDTAADANIPITTDVTASKVIQEIYGIMEKSKTTSNTVRMYGGSSVTNVPVRAK